MAVMAAKFGNERLLGATVALAEWMHVIELGEHLARTLSELLRCSSAKNVGIADRLEGLVQSEVDA